MSTNNSLKTTGTLKAVDGLQVKSSTTSNPRGLISDQYGANSQGARLHLRKARGTEELPTAAQAGDGLGIVCFNGYGDTDFGAQVAGSASIGASAAENWSDVAQGASLVFRTTSVGSATASVKMVIGHDGLVGIGDIGPFVNPASCGFQVDGTGNILRINDVSTSFPSVQGAASTFLQNDGSGNLSWIAAPLTLDAAYNALNYISTDDGLDVLIQGSEKLQITAVGGLLLSDVPAVFNRTTGNSLFVNHTGSSGYGVLISAFGGAVGLAAQSGDSYASYFSNNSATYCTLYLANNDSTGSVLSLFEYNGVYSVDIKVPLTLSSTVTLTLPDDVGSAGQSLKTDGLGNLYWG